MRKRLSLLVLLTAAAGCSDQSSSDQSKARQAYNEAIASYEVAQQGFVSDADAANQDLRKTKSHEEFRREKLDEATKKLEPIANNGTPAQKLAALRLIADADASSASYLTRRGVAEWSLVTNRSTRLLSLMNAAERARSRAAEFESDPSAPVREKLRANQGQQARILAEHAGKANQLRPQIEATEKKIAELKAASDSAVAEARALYDKAFIAKGKEQLDLYKQSDVAGRKGDIALAEARRLEIGLDVTKAEMAIETRQIEMAKETGKAIQTQIEDLEKQQQETRAAREAAIKAQEEIAAKLEKELADVAKAYDSNVKTHFEAADAKLEHAIEQLKSAVNTAGADKKDVQIELLGKYVARLNTLADYIIASQSYGRTLSLLASQAERVMPGKTVFKTVSDAALATAKTEHALAQKVAGDAQGLVAELSQSAQGDEKVAKLVGDSQRHLNDYSVTIDRVMTNSGGEPAAE